MIKAFTYLRRNPNMSPEEFRHYWINVHVPLVRSKMPRVRSYVGYFPLKGAAPFPEGDALLELGFDSLEDRDVQMSSAEFNTPDRIASSLKLLDMSNIQPLIVEAIDFLANEKK